MRITNKYIVYYLQKKNKLRKLLRYVSLYVMLRYVVLEITIGSNSFQLSKELGINEQSRVSNSFRYKYIIST